MTSSIIRRAALLAVAVATVALPGPALGRSTSAAPAPVASPSPGGAPDATGGAPDGWAAAVCTAHARIMEAQPAFTGLGQASLMGDADGMAFSAIEAGLLADQGLSALESLDGTWAPGAAASGFLSAAGFALVDMAVALADADPNDPTALRSALGSAIAAADAWARAGEELALLRELTGLDCAAVPVPSARPLPGPSAEPATPAPIFTGDPELEARFPTEVGGEPVTPSSRTGAELLATSDPDDPVGQAQLQDLTDVLAASGHAIEDVSLAFAFVPTADGYGASITAFRIRGGDAAALLESLIPVVTVDYLDLQRDTVTVDGRELVRVSQGPYDRNGIYEVLVPSGDTLWAVSAADEALAEIVAALPG